LIIDIRKILKDTKRFLFDCKTIPKPIIILITEPKNDTIPTSLKFGEKKLYIEDKLKNTQNERFVNIEMNEKVSSSLVSL
jgi:hypothetical protein